jgi:hypothetical protein
VQKELKDLLIQNSNGDVQLILIWNSKDVIEI